MGWLALAGALVQLALALLRRAPADANRTVIEQELRGALDAITDAQTARRAVRDRHARDPASLRDDDGFRRD
jgi:hypothetical protein